MPRIWKQVKKYERWFLLGIVVIILATFSVASTCSGDVRERRDTAALERLSGSFEAAQGKRVAVDGEEFARIRSRYVPVYRVPVWGPSIRFADEWVSERSKPMGDDAATWAHIAAVGVAREAGYEVSTDEIRTGVKELVERITLQRNGRGGEPFSPELYQRILRNYLRIRAEEFEATVGEILLKDKLFGPGVEALRFSKDREEAFADWKKSRRRVDLEFAAVPAAQFAERVALEETTRTAIAAQLQPVGRLAYVAPEVRRLAATVLAEQTKAGGVLPKDTAAFLATDQGKAFAAPPKPTEAPKPPAEPAKPGEPPAVPSAAPSPAPAAVLVSDPWKNPYEYAIDGTSFSVRSLGPDGKPGTPDDIDRTTASTMETLLVLRRVGDALVAWRATADAWPAKLSDLTTVPPPAADRKAAPAPLATLPKDGFDRELDYDPATAALRSLGADGVKGGPDDLVATVSASRVSVPLPASLAAWSLDGKDGWGGALAIDLKKVAPAEFEVRSAGPDREFGTADDVTEGNDIDLAVYYNPIRMDHRIPERRAFDALHVIPCLVPDAVFAEAWKKHPEYRDEATAFDLFRTLRGAFYAVTRKGDGEGAKEVETDPADPTTGHGAALVAKLRESKAIPADGPVSLVPAPEVFGEQKDPSPSVARPDDPVWKTYVEKGWRRICLRDTFFEKLLAGALSKARTAADAHAAWEKAGKAGPEPALFTFADVLAAHPTLVLSADQVEKGARGLAVHSVPEGGLTREEWEALPLLGDVNTSTEVKRLGAGAWAQIPTLLQEGVVRAAFRVTKIIASRDPELDEVREKVMPGYLESRALARAAKELDLLAPKLREKGSELAAVLVAAGKERDVAGSTGRTGPLVGSVGSSRELVPEADATDEAKAEIRRRNYVRRFGVDEIPTGAEVGTVGTKVLKDDAKDGTRSAYLVRLAWAEDPSPLEFGTKEYAAWLSEAVSPRPTRGTTGADEPRKGAIETELERLMGSWGSVRRLYGIQTASPIEDAPKKAGR